MRFRRSNYTDDAPESVATVHDERGMVDEDPPDRSERVVRESYTDAPAEMDPPIRRERVERESYVERKPAYEAPAYDEAVVDHRVTTRYLESLPARVNAVLFAMLAALEGVLVLRFVLVAYGASRSSGFVDFMYNISWPFVRPFSNAFRNRTWDQGIIEPSTLLAMGVYFLLFMLIALLVNAVLPHFEESDRAVVRRRRAMHS